MSRPPYSNTSRIIAGALRILRSPRRWIKGRNHDVHGRIECYCLNGALVKAETGGNTAIFGNGDARRLVGEAIKQLHPYMRDRSVVGYNDNKRVTHPQILAVLKRALKLSVAADRAA